MYRKLILSGLIVFNACMVTIAQDKIYMSDQLSDQIYRVNASDLGALELFVASENPCGIAYFHTNPSYPLFYVEMGIYRNNDVGDTPNQIIAPINEFNRGVA